MNEIESQEMEVWEVRAEIGRSAVTKSPKAWDCADLPGQACGFAGIKRRAPNQEVCYWQFPARLSFKKIIMDALKIKRR